MGRIGPGVRVADRYLVIEEIGGGGMGVVYRASDERGGSDVALKVLREAAPAEAVRRMQREARATSTLDPARVAQVREVGQTPDGQLYLVMELVRGKTVRAQLREGRIERSHALHIVREVAITLGEAHRAGLVHRDVKPDNIIVQDDGRVVLLDFGIVKHIDGDADPAQLSTQLTTDGTVIGTPAYLAPEQALGRDVGPEVDQFALAVTAFEMLTGKLPWTATDVTRMLAQVLGETPLSASAIDRTLKSAFDVVLKRGLSKVTTGRFRTIEDFAIALTAAERGEVPPSAELVTLPDVPARPSAAREISGRARTRSALLALGALLFVGGAAWRFSRPQASTAAPAADGPSHLAKALLGADSRLACPIFEVRGVAEIGARLGAAAGTLACSRATWFLGGRDDRILPPAALLDAPVQPTEGYADPYGAPEQRGRTIALARSRGTAWLDGVVSRERSTWHVDLSLGTSLGDDVAHAAADAPRFDVAVKRAIETLWSEPGLPRAPIDPEVARWTSYPDAETGLAALDLFQLGVTEQKTCTSLGRRASDLGQLFTRFDAICSSRWLTTGVADAGPVRILETSPASIATSTLDLVTTRAQIDTNEAHRLATKLDDLRAGEPSSFGRATMADAAGHLWTLEGDFGRARSDLMTAVREDPLFIDAWQQLTFVGDDVGSFARAASVAAAWSPWEPMFLRSASSRRTDDLDARLREGRLAWLLEPGLEGTLSLGAALAEAGRPDEVREVAATPIGGPNPSRRVEAYLLGLVDLHDARFDRATSRFDFAKTMALDDFIVVNAVLGRTTSAATQWATESLALPEDQLSALACSGVAPIILCMNARHDLALHCLDRVATLGHATQNGWGAGGEDLLRGARRFADGDVKGAVAAWRPLVAGPDEDIVRLLPTDPFDRAGEPDLAARLDARKMAYRNLAGVSDAAPREAKRAAAAGDKARARDLAQKVIDAWGVADTTVPAVAEMRALLRALDR